jgi:hypothetical protein
MDTLWRKGAVRGHVAFDLTCFSGELEIVVLNGQV